MTFFKQIQYLVSIIIIIIMDLYSAFRSEDTEALESQNQNIWRVGIASFTRSLLF